MVHPETLKGPERKAEYSCSAASWHIADIPAGAGRSSRGRRVRRRLWDHPRGCGEKVAVSCVSRSFQGSSHGCREKVEPVFLYRSISTSSPRVQGEGLVHALGDGGVGIIPAGAGRSGRVAADGLGDGDHPRGCGEKAPAYSPGLPCAGSSPRVRGKGSSSVRVSEMFRIIPAGAGKSGLLVLPCRSLRDHPRGCGEKASAM